MDEPRTSKIYMTFTDIGIPEADTMVTADQTPPHPEPKGYIWVFEDMQFLPQANGHLLIMQAWTLEDEDDESKEREQYEDA